MAGGQVDLAGLTPFEIEALEDELPARLLELLGFRGRAEFRPLLARAREEPTIRAGERIQEGSSC